jgi:hypothetical protein
MKTDNRNAITGKVICAAVITAVKANDNVIRVPYLIVERG